MSQPYIARFFDQRARELATASAESMKRAFAQRIAGASWLDGPTRAEAAAKLDAVTFKLGYPDAWETHAGVELVPDSFFDNRSALIADAYAKARAKLDAPVDKRPWLGSPLELNAWYSPRHNDVTVTALFLSPPFVTIGAPAARNAGVLSMVLGHELTHGFDDAGRDYDASGNLRDWWSRAAEVSFAERRQCIVDQFSGYEVLPGEFVNGELTAGENIADLGGLVTAYAALLEGDPGPGGDGFTAEQVFFLAYAQRRCENARPEWVSAQLLTDPHAPSKLRVNGPLSNMSEFAEAFECPAGSPMVRANPCSVW